MIVAQLPRRIAGQASLAIPLAFLVIFFAGPLAYLFYGSFRSPSDANFFGDRFTLSNYADVLADPFYLSIIWRTTYLTLGAVLTCLLIAFPAALFIRRLPSHRRLMVLACLMLPLMISNVVRGYGWVAILGRRGVINGTLDQLGLIAAPLKILYGLDAVTIGLLEIGLPYMVLSISNTLNSIDDVYSEAAQSLGASPWRTFTHVTWPLASPGVTSGLLICFFLSLSAYVTFSLLGGPRYKMLVSLIFDSVSNFQWTRAAALAFILLCLALIAGVLFQIVLKPQRVRGVK